MQIFFNFWNSKILFSIFIKMRSLVPMCTKSSYSKKYNVKGFFTNIHIPLLDLIIDVGLVKASRRCVKAGAAPG
jgi:hypothetical protein